MNLHRRIPFVALLAGLALAGCPTPPVGPDGGPGPDEDGGTTQVTAETREGFTEAVARFMELRQAGNWSAEQCNAVASSFEEVSDDTSGGIAEALYARGVTFQQCNLHDQARQAFQAALELRADYPPALIQLGVYAMVDGDDAKAQQLFEKAYKADITAYEAYINLAILAFERGNFRPGQQAAEGAADVLIGSALAVQADAVVALENLARFFFDYSQLAEANQRFRRFALLVCQYAITKNPNYAPIYNLRGLIFLAEENIRAAIGDFRKVIERDPDNFEAHMNYASLNLGFRGYSEAQRSYAEALRVRPDSYDALIGLGVAIRGLASEQESMEGEGEYIEGTRYTYAMAVEKYEAAKQLDAARPEAYFNIALVQHRFTNITQPQQYDPAIASYREALGHCSGRPPEGSDMNYEELRAAIQENLDRAVKDQETLVQMQEMDRQVREADAAMAAAEAAAAAAEAAAAAQAAAQGGGETTPPPEGGGETTPPPEGTPAPEGGTP
jgi:tetratricopeptide (TPR) repeat protein